MSAKKKRSDATAAEIAAQAARETRSSARMSGVPLKVIREWKEGMTQEERERVIAEQKLTEEQVATLDATAHARALAEAAGDRTLTLEEEVVEINRQIEKLGEADEEEAIQMLDAELLAEEEAARAEEEARSESPKAEEETRNEGEGAPRAEVPAEAKPEAGGGEASSRRELDALRVRAAELDDRLRAKGLRKAKRNKIAEELAGVQARMQELSGGNLVLFSRGDGAQGRPALSPTKAALRDRLLLKIARTAGIRVIREGTEQITASARNAEARGLSFKREAFPATAEEREGIEREAKGKGTWLKAPNGKPTNLTPEQWVTVRTRAFKEWFGDWENDAKNASKVVDGNGEPMVVYHGTGASFTAFDKAKIGSSTNNKGIFGNGFYMTEDSSYASYYNRSDGRINKDGRGNVMPLFVSLKNPFDWSAPDAVRVAEAAGFPKSRIKDSKLLPLTEEKQILSFTENLKKSGHDGVVFTFDDGTREFVAFEPEQIKSATENVGTFDAGNPDIRYSISPLYSGASQAYWKPNLQFVGAGTGGNNEGRGLYSSGVHGVAQDKYATLALKNADIYNLLVVYRGETMPLRQALEKVESVLDEQGEVNPKEGTEEWIIQEIRYYLHSYLDTVGSIGINNNEVINHIEEAFRSSIPPDYAEMLKEVEERMRFPIVKRTMYYDDVLKRWSEYEGDGRRAEERDVYVDEHKHWTNYDDVEYVKNKYDRFKKLAEEQGDELKEARERVEREIEMLHAALPELRFPRPAVMTQTWWTNRPEGDVSHLLSWFEAVTPEQMGWILDGARKAGFSEEEISFLQRERIDDNDVLIGYGNRMPSGREMYMRIEAIAMMRDGGFGEKSFDDITAKDLWAAHRHVVERTGQFASEFFVSADIDGMMYPVDYRNRKRDGRKTGWNYVAFSDEHLRVDAVDEWNPETGKFERIEKNQDIRYSLSAAEQAAWDGGKVLRDGEGVVYGYWDEGRGELHLNEDFADFDTPLHEWAHVWLSWVRKNDARVAERALALTKETKFYKELRADKEGAYAGLSDDALAEEAFAMLCGKDGGEIMAQEGVSTWTKLRRAVLNVFKAALRTLGVSESVLSRLTFRDMQSLCLRDLLDEETFSLKELRASVSAKRALEDAATEAVIDNGIEDAARKRAIRSASIAAAGKLLMKKDRMTREQVESAETLALLEEAVGRMLPTEPADVVKAAARAARTAAKVVYSSRQKADAAIVDSLEAVREASRAGRILRTQRVLKAADRAVRIDADLYADAREYVENYTKMTEAGRRSHVRGISPTLLKRLYGAEAFSRDFLERGENAKDMTGAIADIVRGRLPADASPYDVLNATRETLRKAYAHQARTWVPSASRERALKFADAIDVEDTLDGVLAAGRKAEAFLREHGVRQAAEATMKRLPTPDEVMLGMLSIRRTGKFSLTAWAEPTGRNTTRKTRRRAG